MQGIWRRPYGRDGNASENDADKAGGNPFDRVDETIHIDAFHIGSRGLAFSEIGGERTPPPPFQDRAA